MLGMVYSCRLYVCCGNPQPAFHRLNSIYFIFFRDTVIHLHLGIVIDLVRAFDHAFAGILGRIT